MDELAAEELGALVVEQDDRDVLVHCQAAVLERRSGRARPPPTPRRRRLGPAAASRGQLLGRQARRARRRADGRTGRAPRRGTPARSGGSPARLSTSSSNRSSRRIVGRLSHAGRRPMERGGVPLRHATVAPRRVVLGSDGHRRPPGGRPRPRPRRRLRGARHRPPGPALLDRPADARRSAVPPRRPPRTPSSAPTRRSPATTATGSASCGCVRGWRRSSSTCAGRGSARRAARGAAPLSLDIEASPLPEPAATDAATIPAAVAERHAERERWAALLACSATRLSGRRRAPPRRRPAYPELATALGRPEGTVKAQVHRGLALLRTALEASDRLERQEMTA